MKKLLFLLTLAFTINVYAQEDKTVTLVVSGQGKTQDEAKQNALRSAIEQAFGTFISSKTEILNDNLVKDEIISVANGNIQKFEIISESINSQGAQTAILKATVSVSKLTSFVRSKGIEHELQGELFAFNINQKKLNEKNEIMAIANLNETISELLKNSFDFELIVSEPTVNPKNGANFIVPIGVIIKANANVENYKNAVFNTIKAISLNDQEKLDYDKIGLPSFKVTIASDDKKTGQFYLRNSGSIIEILNIIFKIRDEMLNFRIKNGIDDLKIGENNSLSGLVFQDISFRPILSRGNDGGSCGICYQSLFNSVSESCREVQRGRPPFIPKFDKISIINVLDYYNLVIEYGFQKISSCGGSYFDIADKKMGYSFLKKYLTKDQSGYIKANFGFTISLVNLKAGNIVLDIKMNDRKTLEELKKIKKYEIQTN
jgi:hypothetical protein